MLNQHFTRRPYDHIMANTWRLILEDKTNAPGPKNRAQLVTNSIVFEEILVEYRLIGLSLADPRQPDHYS